MGNRISGYAGWKVLFLLESWEPEGCGGEVGKLASGPRLSPNFYKSIKERGGRQGGALASLLPEEAIESGRKDNERANCFLEGEMRTIEIPCINKPRVIAGGKDSFYRRDPGPLCDNMQQDCRFVTGKKKYEKEGGKDGGDVSGRREGSSKQSRDILRIHPMKRSGLETFWVSVIEAD